MGLAADLTEKIKGQIRKQGYTYKIIAKKLDLSEATLKRCFSQNIFTLDRIEKMCAILGVSLEELARSSDGPYLLEVLSEAQEKALANEESLFVLFYLLASGLTSEKIKKYFVFEPKQLDSAFLKLDRLKLIKFLPGGKTIPCTTQSVWWAVDGPLAAKYHDLIRKDFMSSVFQGKHEGAWILAGNISSSSLQTFRKKTSKLAADFKELMTLDKYLPPNEKINITFFAGFRPWILPPISKYRRANTR